jgi:hypothetical protein
LDRKVIFIGLDPDPDFDAWITALKARLVLNPD